jgi:hypothetical protein
LLDPFNPHGLGNRFSRAFFRPLIQRGLIVEDELDTALIRTEHKNVDIRVSTDSHEIIVENKLNASDQEYQIARYLTESSTPYSATRVVYLTPFGHSPTRQSYIGDGSRSERFQVDPIGGDWFGFAIKPNGREETIPIAQMSYTNDVTHALDELIESRGHVPDHCTDVLAALRQYREVCADIARDLGRRYMTDEQEFLAHDARNLAVAAQVQYSYSDALATTVDEFIEGITARFQETANSASSNKAGHGIEPGQVEESLAKKMIPPRGPDLQTAIDRWVPRTGKTRTVDQVAVLWMGSEDGDWAYKFELATNWVLFGVVPLRSGADRLMPTNVPEEKRVSEPEQIRPGRRHAGPWKNLSVDYPLLCVLHDGNKQPQWSHEQIVAGMDILKSPDIFYMDYVLPLFDKKWDYVVQEVLRWTPNGQSGWPTVRGDCSLG